MQERQGAELVHRFFDGTGTTYDLIVKLCTLGFDHWWKEEIIRKIPQGSTRVLDQACGTGILTFKIARKFPGIRVVGVDLEREYLGVAQKKAKESNLENVEFVLGRAEDVSLKQSFDCITSSYLAKYAELEKLVRNIDKMLRSDGLVIMHDFTYPPDGMFSRLWHLYFTALQTIGSALSPSWAPAFGGLPQLLRETRWVTELPGVLERNGFREIVVESHTLGTSAIVIARKS